ncbi:Chromatin assembly factor 1 subunit A [Bagarius yarrelli]|uniref:Chromatin assembly factor 1 subunit A n=1 Tax=Bagarius yarrelli TaxID=175774 RepID=A0A556TS02_BAGYA|nr:Chromatin assembly factor 1 subunit A [Bagarius yarrelli]
MDLTDKASTANKKLVQARLPFKRLNPEPKETRKAKKSRTVSSAPPTNEINASDGENEVDAISATLKPRPALKNGRGPLDGFMRRTTCPPISSVSPAVIDLTEDSNSAPPVDASCPPTDKAADNTQNATEAKEPEASSPVVVPQSHEAAVSPSHEETMETDEAEDSVNLPQLDSTLESDTDTEQNQRQQETEESQENESLLSNSSVSLVESSPEPSKSRPTTPASVPRMNTGQKQLKRRSLKMRSSDSERRKSVRNRRLELPKRRRKRKHEDKKRRSRKKNKKRKRRMKGNDEKKKEKHDKEKAERQQAKEEQRKVKIEAKLEEKRKKEEEKRLKEEKERIKAEKAEITRFLQKPKPQLAPKTLASVCGKFAPFEIKEHMALAPLTRVQCEEAVLEALDRFLTEPDEAFDCLQDWITHKPRTSGPTKTKHADMLRDCMVVNDSGPKPEGDPDHKCYGRMKLLQFHENYRPAYWGTWRKKSTHISPRCPFKQDKDLLDYEVDSDEEWEEEEPGESLSHSEGEGGDPEKQKVRQKLKAREWDELMAKSKLRVLESVARGCIWEGEDPPLNMLQPYAICMIEPLTCDEPNTPEETVSRQQRIDQWLTQLLPLLHGNVNSSKVIISEFQEFCRQQNSSPDGSPQNSSDIPPRIRIKRLIKENAVYEKRSAYRRCCWYVHSDVLTRFGQEGLPVPSQWTYLTSGAHTARDESTLGSQGSSPTSSHSTSTTPSNKRKSGSNQSITKYMKKCGEPEQAEAIETDGFQADTEEEEEDDDCVVVLGEQSGSSEQNSQIPRTETKSTEVIDTLLALPCPTPATA